MDEKIEKDSPIIKPPQENKAIPQEEKKVDEWTRSDISPMEQEEEREPEHLLNQYEQLKKSYNFENFYIEQILRTTSRIEKAGENTQNFLLKMRFKAPYEWIEELLAFIQAQTEELNLHIKKKKKLEELRVNEKLAIMENEISKALLKFEELQDILNIENAILEEMHFALKEGASLRIKQTALQILFAPIMDSPSGREVFSNFISTVMDALCNSSEGPQETAVPEPLENVAETASSLVERGVEPAYLQQLAQLALNKYILGNQSISTTLNPFITNEKNPDLKKAISFLAAGLEGELALIKGEDTDKALGSLSRFTSNLKGIPPSNEEERIFQCIRTIFLEENLHKLAQMALLSKMALEQSPTLYFNYFNLKQ